MQSCWQPFGNPNHRIYSEYALQETYRAEKSKSKRKYGLHNGENQYSRLREDHKGSSILIRSPEQRLKKSELLPFLYVPRYVDTPRVCIAQAIPIADSMCDTNDARDHGGSVGRSRRRRCINRYCLPLPHPRRHPENLIDFTVIVRAVNFWRGYEENHSGITRFDMPPLSRSGTLALLFP